MPETPIGYPSKLPPGALRRTGNVNQTEVEAPSSYGPPSYPKAPRNRTSTSITVLTSGSTGHKDLDHERRILFVIGFEGRRITSRQACTRTRGYQRRLSLFIIDYKKGGSMRRIFFLGMLITALASAGAFEVDLAEAQTCTVWCQYRPIQCCTSGTCSASPGSVNCNGTVVSCSTINSYDSCVIQCATDRDYCFENCFAEPYQCSALCQSLYNSCVNRCGTPPQSNFGC